MTVFITKASGIFETSQMKFGSDSSVLFEASESFASFRRWIICRSHLLDLPDVEVLEAHSAFAATVELECDDPVEIAGGRILVVHGPHAVEEGHHPVAEHRKGNVVPLSRFQGRFSFRTGLDQPTPAAAFIEPSVVVAGNGVHLHLNPLDVDSLQGRVVEDAVVAGSFPIEIGSGLKILVGFCGGQEYCKGSL